MLGFHLQWIFSLIFPLCPLFPCEEKTDTNKERKTVYRVRTSGEIVSVGDIQVGSAVDLPNTFDLFMIGQKLCQDFLVVCIMCMYKGILKH